jgi:NAD(P)-dependent dehydrogenase (short-subunit alcohol dehydrogenase family)
VGKLSGKRALITGATTGIGLETAKLFLEEGARVAITGVNPATLAAATEELGSNVLAIPSDAGNVPAQETLARKIQDSFGRLDILVANAGVVDFRPIGSWDEEGYDRLFSINLKGPFFLMQALLPILENPSSVVLTGSVNAHVGAPNSSIYAASKAGLISLARTVSGELVSRGIRVNVVSPGPIDTPLYSKLGLPDADAKAMSATLKDRIPLHRFGTAREVANAILILASAESAFTVGSELIIDGGLTNNL